MRRALLVLRIALGLVFVYAAYTKLRQPWLLFAMSIDSYKILPDWAVTTLARTLPWLELAIGLLLIIGWKLRFAAAAATALLLGFFAIMVRSYVKDMGIDCGCFGLGEALSVKTLIRDGALLLLAILITAASFGRRPAQTAIAK